MYHTLFIIVSIQLFGGVTIICDEGALRQCVMEKRYGGV